MVPDNRCEVATSCAAWLSEAWIKLAAGQPAFDENLRQKRWIKSLWKT